MTDDLPPTARAEYVWRDIQQLTHAELLWIWRQYQAQLDEDDDQEGGVGVREPRPTPPESPGDEIALSLPT